MRTRAVWLLWIALGAAAPGARAQTVQGGASEVAALREQLARLREELSALKAEMTAVKRELAPAARQASARDSAVAPATAGEQPAVTAESFDMLRTQVAEQAQTKVESTTKMPVRLYGTILTNTYVNSGEANWLDNPNIVAAPPPGTPDTGTMSASARQSRVGVDVGVIPVGSWQASGTLQFDFFGGAPNFQNGPVMGLPRLVYAFGRIEHAGTAVQVGQDHTLLAPRDPTSLAALSFPLFFRSGNLYLRAPQARVEQTFGRWTLAGGIVAPVAGDFGTVFEFAPPAGIGERSKRPAFQGRLAFAAGSEDAVGEVGLGFSAHYGWRRRVTTLDESWAVAVDGTARVGRIGIGGEYYRADNAEVFGAAISQPGRASGGWVEGRLAVTRRADLNAGFGIDRPEDALGRLLRSRNRSAFGNVIVRLTPEVETSLEYRWLETDGGLVPVTRTNHHVNAVFAVRF